jgi:hypothetical protein
VLVTASRVLPSKNPYCYKQIISCCSENSFPHDASISSASYVTLPLQRLPFALPSVLFETFVLVVSESFLALEISALVSDASGNMATVVVHLF